MKIFLVEVHHHYETQTIISAHVNKENAYKVAIKEGEQYGAKLIMKKYDGSETICGTSTTSFNVIEMELDMMTSYGP